MVYTHTHTRTHVYCLVTVSKRTMAEYSMNFCKNLGVKIYSANIKRRERNVFLVFVTLIAR